MKKLDKKTHKKLQPEERDRIAIWKAEGIGPREISRRLKRSPGTISDEIKRNKGKGYYISIYAQNRSEERRSKASFRYPLKNKSIYKYVMRKLRSGWSPEQIAGRLKLKHPVNGYWHIHHETIYRFIYSKKNENKKLWEYLPRKRKRRQKKYGRKARKGMIPNRTSIHLRPREIENKETFGHWEGDSIVGKSHNGGAHTEVERKTRFLKASLLKTFKPSETADVVRDMFEDLPIQAKKSITLDNGFEFKDHEDIGIQTYFCDPYSSWQRGSNEYHNGLIRRYLPKGTDFSKVTKEELHDIIEEINDRPRKCLQFHTPREMFIKELEKAGVRIQMRM